jgi:hypothetical protein
MGSSFMGLIPGAFVAMAFIIGSYSHGESGVSCARTLCRSLRVEKIQAEVSTWSVGS